MLGRGALLSVLNNAVGATLGLVSLNFITAYAGKSAFGMWVYALAILGVAVLVGHLGFPQAHVKRISAGTREAEANGTFLVVKLALTAAFAGVSLAAYWVITGPLGRRVQDTTLPIILVALAFHAVSSLRNFFDSCFQGRRLFAVYESVQFVDTLLTVPLTMTAALTVGRLNGAPAPWAGWGDAVIGFFDLEGPVGAARAGLWIGLAFLGGKVGSLAYAALQFLLHRFPLGRPTWAMFREYRRFAFPMAIVGTLTLLYSQTDRVVVGFFGTEQNVAAYGFALQLVAPILLISVTVGNVLFPTASLHHASRDLPAVRRLVDDADRYLSMAILGQLMLAFVFAPEAVRVVTSGRAFDDAVPILRALLPLAYFASLGTPTRSALLGLGRPNIVARLSAFNLLLFAVLAPIFVAPSILGVRLLGLSGLGAALVASLLALVSYAYLRWAARDILPRAAVPSGFWHQSVAASAAGAILWVLRDLYFLEMLTRAWHLVIVGAVGLCLYLLILLLIGGITKADRAHAKDLFHPARFFRYLHGELRGQAPRGPVK